MDGKSLPHFPDELRVRIGGNCVGAEIALGLLSDHIARGPPPSIGYGVHPPHRAGCLAATPVKPKIRGEES
jgi:hypothetical protein